MCRRVKGHVVKAQWGKENWLCAVRAVSWRRQVGTETPDNGMQAPAKQARSRASAAAGTGEFSCLQEKYRSQAMFFSHVLHNCPSMREEEEERRGGRHAQGDAAPV